MMNPTYALLSTVLLLAAGTASPAGDELGRRMTLYQGGFGYVQETRPIDVQAGSQIYTIEALPQTLRADSLDMRLGERGSVLGATWRQPPASRSELLATRVGEGVILAPKSSGGGSERSGRLAAVIDGLPVVRIGERLELLDEASPWRLVLPAETPVRGALAVRLTSETGGPAALALSYLAGGLSWAADYAVTLDGDSASLRGFANLRNDTDTDFKDADLRLVAGDVQGPAPAPPEPFAQTMARADAGARQRQSDPSGAWHLYELPAPVSLRARTTTRVALIRQQGWSVERRFRVDHRVVRGRRDGRTEAAVEVRLKLTPPASAKAPLPAGTVRVLDAATGAGPAFQGTDRVTHTPAGKAVELTLGSAFDITATRQQTRFDRLAGERYRIGYEIVLRNASKRAATIVVTEHLPGDWRLENGKGWERIAAGALRQTLEVSAGEDATLGYQAVVTP